MVFDVVINDTYIFRLAKKRKKKEKGNQVLLGAAGVACCRAQPNTCGRPYRGAVWAQTPSRVFLLFLNRSVFLCIHTHAKKKIKLKVRDRWPKWVTGAHFVTKVDSASLRNYKKAQQISMGYCTPDCRPLFFSLSKGKHTEIKNKTPLKNANKNSRFGRLRPFKQLPLSSCFLRYCVDRLPPFLLNPMPSSFFLKIECGHVGTRWQRDWWWMAFHNKK